MTEIATPDDGRDRSILTKLCRLAKYEPSYVVEGYEGYVAFDRGAIQGDNLL